MKQIQLHTAQLNDAGEYCDGGDVLVVGKDIDKERAAQLVAAGQAAAPDTNEKAG